VSAPARKLATVQDLLAIPNEERRHELIEGTIEPKGAASGRHGAAQRKLAAHIDPFDRRPGERAPGGWWFATEVDVTAPFSAMKTRSPERKGNGSAAWRG
jgi:hypothetical protein